MCTNMSGIVREAALAPCSNMGVRRKVKFESGDSTDRCTEKGVLQEDDLVFSGETDDVTDKVERAHAIFRDIRGGGEDVNIVVSGDEDYGVADSPDSHGWVPVDGETVPGDVGDNGIFVSRRTIPFVSVCLGEEEEDDTGMSAVNVKAAVSRGGDDYGSICEALHVQMKLNRLRLAFVLVSRAFAQFGSCPGVLYSLVRGVGWCGCG